MRYPKECPVFEITIDDGEFVPRGGIVEGVEIGVDGYGNCYPGRIGVRVLDESNLRAIPRRHPFYGYCGIVSFAGDMRPLTESAKQMLAIARNRK